MIALLRWLWLWLTGHPVTWGVVDGYEADICRDGWAA